MFEVFEVFEVTMTSEIKTEPACSVEDPDFASGISPANNPGVANLKRVRLPEDLDSLDKEALLGLWNEQDLYIDQLENNLRDNETKSVCSSFSFLTFNLLGWHSRSGLRCLLVY